MDISRWVAHWAAWSPAKTALRFEGTQITYAELEDRIARLAGVLHHRGAARGDRVAYLGPNCPELLEAFLACARLGAAFVPLNARMPSAELEVYVKHTRPKLITAEDSFHGTARAALAGGTAEILPFAAGGGIGVAEIEIQTGSPPTPAWLRPRPCSLPSPRGPRGLPRARC
ncbi:MAG TPA: AMP-binding protein [Streptosporangiaceae bacterium]